ncbi:MAG TPA: hypothetical protein VGN07_09130 [Steroidobacteraceae bacterium]|jgi:hypothetical protein
MPQPSVEPAPKRPSSPHRLRFELILASVLLAFGLFAVPALVYWVGIKMLGPYGDGDGASQAVFYTDFFGDLATPVARAWALALGPLVVVSLVRLLFIRRPEPGGEQDDAPRQVPARAQAPVSGRRKEPSVNLD